MDQWRTQMLGGLEPKKVSGELFSLTYGALVAQIDLNEAGYLDVTVPAGHAATLYARTGDSPVFLLLSLILGALAFRRWRNAIAMRREAG